METTISETDCVMALQPYAHYCLRSSALLPTDPVGRNAHHTLMGQESLRQRQIAFVYACKDATGVDLTTLARRIGRAPSTLNRFVKPDWPHRLGSSTIALLEDAAGLSFADFDSASRESRSAALLTPSLNIPVVGEVQAGAWKMAYEAPQEEQELVVVSHPGGPDVQYFGLRVVGDSMDQIYPPGTVLICVRRMDFWGVIRHGDHVIVQRRSDIDDRSEYTVKEVQQDPAKDFWLVPRSTNPAHQALRVGGWDLEQSQAGNGDIEIIAVVVGEYRWRHRPQD